MPFLIKSRALGANMQEPTSLRVALIRLAVVMGGYLWLIYYLLHHIEPAYAQLAAVLLSVVVSPVLVLAVFAIARDWLKFARDQPLKRWQGSYYSFDGYQVRIVEAERGTWIVLDDAMARAKMRVSDAELAALGPDALLYLPELKKRAISDAALLALLSKRNYGDANKFRLWLERDVFPPLYRKRTGQRVPYTMGQGVAAPAAAIEPPPPKPAPKKPRTSTSKW